MYNQQQNNSYQHQQNDNQYQQYQHHNPQYEEGQSNAYQQQQNAGQDQQNSYQGYDQNQQQQGYYYQNEQQEANQPPPYQDNQQHQSGYHGEVQREQQHEQEHVENNNYQEQPQQHQQNPDDDVNTQPKQYEIVEETGQQQQRQEKAYAANNEGRQSQARSIQHQQSQIDNVEQRQPTPAVVTSPKQQTPKPTTQLQQQVSHQSSRPDWTNLNHELQENEDTFKSPQETMSPKPAAIVRRPPPPSNKELPIYERKKKPVENDLLDPNKKLTSAPDMELMMKVKQPKKDNDTKDEEIKRLNKEIAKLKLAPKIAELERNLKEAQVLVEDMKKKLKESPPSSRDQNSDYAESSRMAGSRRTSSLQKPGIVMPSQNDVIRARGPPPPPPGLVRPRP